jgi:hypothetical protein
VLTLTPKTCANCGTPFESKRKDTIYCSDKCKMEAFKKRKLSDQQTLFNTPQKPIAETVKQPIMVTKEITKAPPDLGIASQFVIDHQKDIIAELRRELQASKEELKKSAEEKMDLKEQLKDLQNELEAKPRGLQGFITTNPGVVEKAVEMFGPLLVKIGEKAMAEDQPKAISGPSQSIASWFAGQTESVQKHFIELIQILASNPETAENKLIEIKRSLMNVQPGKSATPSFRG